MNSSPDYGPRPDCSGVDPVDVALAVSELTELLTQDLNEFDIAEQLRGYCRLHLRPRPELWICVHDELARQGIISKTQFRTYLQLVSPEILQT